MEILFVIEYFYPGLSGGEGLVSWRISNALAEKGHKVCVVTSRLNGTPKHETANHIEIFRPFPSGGIITRGGISGVMAIVRRALFLSRLYWYLKKFLKQHPVDIIINHAYVPTMPTTYLGAKNHIPVITSVRALAAKKWFQLAGPVLALFGYLTETIVLRFAKHTALVCPSREVAKRVQAHTSARVFTIPNPLDLDEIEQLKAGPDADSVRKSLGINRGERFLLFAGSLVKVKNIDGLIKALSSSEDNFKLALVGEGPERPRIEKLARKLGLQDRVVLLGQKSHKETLSLMKSCDVFVLPSKSEAFSNVAVEALALGKPVIATKVGVLPEIESKNLYLVDDVQEINQLLKDGIEPKHDNRVLKKYSTDRIIKEFESMLQGEIKRKRETSGVK
jgi:glycosyltransferase involved in cell wall biosynthesis